MRRRSGLFLSRQLCALTPRMIAGLPYTALRDAVLTHPTLSKVSYLCSHGNLDGGQDLPRTDTEGREPEDAIAISLH